MNDDQWYDVVEKLKKVTHVLSDEKRDLIRDLAYEGTIEHVVEGELEELIFESAGSKMKIERETKARVLDKRVIAQKRVEGAQVNYILSADETVSHERLFKWDDIQEEWKEVEFKI